MIYLTTLVFIIALLYTFVLIVNLLDAIHNKKDFDATQRLVFIAILWGIFFHLYNFVV